jgi:ferredoxin
MQISIDVTRCVGHGRCYVFAAELIDAADDGFGVADGVPVPPEHEASAHDAVRNCPESAVVISD